MRVSGTKVHTGAFALHINETFMIPMDAQERGSVR